VRRTIVPLVAAALTLLSACSVPTSESATAVAPDDLPPELQPVVTQSSTTSIPPTGAEVTIYLYNTETRVLEPVVRRVPTESVTVNTAMTELFKPTTEAEADANLISLLEADAEDEELAGGLQLEQVQAGPTVVRIRIRGTPSGGPQAQAQAFAQMVFTASEPGLEGAKPEVVFQRPNGDGVQVVTEEAVVDDRPVRRDDYPTLDPDNIDPPATTTTTDRQRAARADRPPRSTTTTTATG